MILPRFHRSSPADSKLAHGNLCSGISPALLTDTQSPEMGDSVSMRHTVHLRLFVSHFKADSDKKRKV